MKLFLTALITVTATMIFACANGEKASNTNTQIAAPAPATSTSNSTVVEAAGRSLYMDNCAACHKENGEGGVIEIEGKRIKPDNLISSKIKSFSDEKIAGYIRKGIPDEGMPAFKDKLTEDQIREIVSYIRTDLQN